MTALMLFPLPAGSDEPCDQDSSGAVRAAYALTTPHGEFKLCGHHARRYMTPETERAAEPALATHSVLDTIEAGES